MGLENGSKNLFDNSAARMVKVSNTYTIAGRKVQFHSRGSAEAGSDLIGKF
jgi:hypothetical protein